MLVLLEETFLVLTVASEEPSSAFKRFLRSVSINKLPTKVLGQGKKKLFKNVFLKVRDSYD